MAVIIVCSQDTDEFILPTGANKTRGRFELAFFTIGGCCITGIFISSSSHTGSPASSYNLLRRIDTPLSSLVKMLPFYVVV